MVNPNMEWYLLPGMSDIPEIDVTLVDQPERGVIGLGEPPVDLDGRRDRQRGCRTPSACGCAACRSRRRRCWRRSQQERAGGTL